jgi:DNA-directed RNA polymerase subunit M/transcription elongation factor TFIIS
MESIDPEEARRQLRGTYERMTEDELCGVAKVARDLTPIAREALQAEISGRGLNIELKTAPPQPAPIDTPDVDASGVDTSDTSDLDLDLDLVNVSRLWDAAEAQRVKEILDAAFVQSFLGPDDIVDLEDFKSSFDGGVDLKVRGVDYARACAALANSSRAEEDREEDQVEDAEEDLDYAVHCPKCKSPEVVFQGKDPEAANPAVDAPFNWSCDACGYQWKDDGIEQKL